MIEILVGDLWRLRINAQEIDVRVERGSNLPTSKAGRKAAQDAAEALASLAEEIRKTPRDGYEPDLDEGLARAIVARVGGRIVARSPRPEPTPPADAVF